MKAMAAASGVLGLIGFFSLAWVPSQANAGTSDVLIVRGDTVAGWPGTVYFADPPTLGDSGQVVGKVRLIMNGTFTGDAFYRAGVGVPTVSVAYAGQAVDGGETITGLSGAAINANDQVALTIRTGVSIANGLFFFDDVLGLRPLVLPGDVVPDSSGGLIQTFLGIGLNGAGQIAAQANWTGGNSILLADSGSGDLDTIVRTGQPAPDGPGIFANTGSASLNDAGQTAFFFNVTEGGIFTDRLIVRADPTPSGLSLFEVARSGDSAPGSSGAFSGIGSTPSMNASGQVAFVSGLDVNTTGAGGNDTGIYLYDDLSGLEVLVDSNTALPGGGFFQGIRDRWELNDDGQVAVIVDVRDVPATRDRGIFRFGSGGAQAIAMEGDAVPGGEGTFFDFGPPSQNSAGEIVFRASLLGVPGYENELSSSIFTYSDANGLVEIVGRGDSLLGEVLLGASISPPFNGQNAFNSSGQVAYFFALADGRLGVAIWTPGDDDPSLTITSPLPSEAIPADEVLVEGIATDDGEIVSVFVNGVQSNLTSTGNPNDPAEVFFSALVPLVPGTNLIVAVAHDDSGNTSQGSVAVESEPPGPDPLVCDVNGDRTVDMSDIGAIFAARGGVATGPDDPRDSNGDGVISINDGRLCVLQCTNYRCAPSVN